MSYFCCAKVLHIFDTSKKIVQNRLKILHFFRFLDNYLHFGYPTALDFKDFELIVLVVELLVNDRKIAFQFEQQSWLLQNGEAKIGGYRIVHRLHPSEASLPSIRCNPSVHWKQSFRPLEAFLLDFNWIASRL